MKYTIEGFSQKKLIEFDFDMSDALILRWFIDFSASGRMKKIVCEKSVYYLVRYQGILTDLPLLKITSIKGLSKRFDKYVSKGLIAKTYRRIGNGTDTYFCCTPLITSLQYDEEIKQSTVVSIKEIRQEPQLPSDDNCNQSMGTTVPIKEIRQEPQLPSDGNYNICQTGTTVLVALNTNSSTSTKETTTTLLSTEHRQHQLIFLQVEIKKYFNPALFSSSFWNELHTFLYSLHKSTISPDIITEYIQFVYDRTISKKPNSTVNYFYSIICKDFMIQLFFQYLHDKNAKRKGVHFSQNKQTEYECPVCGIKHDTYINCPECGLPEGNRTDAKYIILQKKVYALDSESKIKLEKELTTLLSQTNGEFSFASIKELNKKSIPIYAAYGINIADDECLENNTD